MLSTIGLDKKKIGLSHVITTLILLVVSVLLSAVVAYYAINITTTRTSQEELKVSYSHIWVDSDNQASVGIFIKNIGAKDVLVDKLTIRGVEIDWNNAYYNRSSPSSDLTWINMTDPNVLATFEVNATDDVPLKSGEGLIIYVSDPPFIELRDIGTTVSLTVFTINAQWIEEVNVEYRD